MKKVKERSIFSVSQTWKDVEFLWGSVVYSINPAGSWKEYSRWLVFPISSVYRGISCYGILLDASELISSPTKIYSMETSFEMCLKRDETFFFMWTLSHKTFVLRGNIIIWSSWGKNEMENRNKSKSQSK